MAVGFTTLRLETLRLLNEVNDTVVGEVATGVGGTATSDTDDAILLYLNEAAADMCRTCVYFPVSIDVTGHTGRVYSHAQGSLVSPISIKLTASTTPLIHCGENELRSYDTSYLSVTGTPSYWYKIGTTAVGLYYAPTASTSFTISGSGLPTKLTSSSAAVAIGTVTITGTNSFVANQEIVFDTSTVTNIVAGVTYYVSATALTTSTFQISATSGGSSIIPTGGTGGTFIVYGGNYSFISDDLLIQALPAYAAQKIALKNYDDPSLVGRAFWKDWYDQVRMQLWTRMDMSLKGPNGLFSIPPIAQGTK